MSKRSPPPAASGEPLAVRRDGARIWSHIRQKWLTEKPEERVRQEYVCVLVNEYGYALDQMDEELSMTGRGTGQARADIVVWRTSKEKADKKPPLIVVECKSDNVTIRAEDYHQGDNYARIVLAPFVVTHNSRETKFWRVEKDRMPGWLSEVENVPKASATDRQIEELLKRLKTFREDEFADLLHKCHNVIRNAEQRDPADAFDEIAKVLFVKVWVERELRAKRKANNLFDVEYLDSLLGDNPLDQLFQQTKHHFAKDRIFTADDRIKLRRETGREIVKLLERYNLSDTSEDVKGIAFERFLGRTFRGEIGQFFTPRSIVEFMIRMIDPKEGEVACDPASGSGGFLIRFFEIVRESIHARADAEYRAVEESVATLPDEERAKKLVEADRTRREQLDPHREGSPVWRLANRCIYGCDANERMARTSKMNMIMHGDGHGGVHHHNGFLNVNGIFEGRFDVVLTNPPFGANVPKSAIVEDGAVHVSEDHRKLYRETYGAVYDEAQSRVEAARGKPIASLFQLPLRGTDEESGGDVGKIKTELLFIERCLDLLKPGGRLGVVLPEGVFNNPSLAFVRAFTEDRAFIRAVVSLPQETFVSSGATVKASLLFLQKFTVEDQTRFDQVKADADREVRAKYAATIASESARLEVEITKAKSAMKLVRAKGTAAEVKAAQEALKEAQRTLKTYLTDIEASQVAEARALLKERFDYPIFMYDAEKVGITATGEADENELYPNQRLPSGVERTALDHYREFLPHVGEPGFFV